MVAEMNAIRKLARTVAKNQMKKKGMVQICKHDPWKYSTGSYFSNHWKDHVKY
jgi:hypothetical protein